MRIKLHFRKVYGLWWCEGGDTQVCAPSWDEAYAIWLCEAYK